MRKYENKRTSKESREQRIREDYKIGKVGIFQRGRKGMIY